MEVSIILGLLGGLSLFLYGMQMMSSGLEDVAGNRIKIILEKITSNRFLGVFVGALITAIIQSSSATTVMVVGFVNSGFMTLNQAVWLIMGANIGTTVTGQFIALDVGMIAPLFAFLGVSMIVFLKSQKVHNIGKILAGLGILFIGMNMMSDAMLPLRESKEFISLMTKFSNPFLGIAVGAIFTAIIQSSSASVGILQALAIAGVINFDSAVYILFGQNIGTCITSIIASIGTNTAAKRTTIIHLLFNITGTIIFTILCTTLPVSEWIEHISSTDVSKQIANMHTIFNIVTTLLLLPFGNYLALFAEKVLPDKKEKQISITNLSKEFAIGGRKLGVTAVHTELVAQEIDNIISMASKNTIKAFSSILDRDITQLDVIKKREKDIDLLNKEISQYISKILVHNNNRKNVAAIEQYFLITGNAERIGDHAINIADYAEEIKSKSIKFSKSAITELSQMRLIVEMALNKILIREENLNEWLLEIVDIEEKIDDMTRKYRTKHLKRMHKGKCSEEACIIYSEILIDFERIGDHILNIGQAYSKIGKLS